MANIKNTDEVAISYSELLKKSQDLFFFKELTNVKSDDVTQEKLDKLIDTHIRSNICYLQDLYSLLKHMPNEVKTHFDELSKYYGKSMLYLKKLRKIKYLIKHNECFKLYNDYIARVVEQDAYIHYDSQQLNDQEIFQDLCADERVIYQCLIYKLSETYVTRLVSFNPVNILINFHFLEKWKKENLSKKIKKLSNDEIEVIAGLVHELSNKQMLTVLNFSAQVQNEKDIEEILKKLPEKFKVHNITQVIFKINNLVPNLWRITKRKDVIKAIRGLYEPCTI